MKNRLVVALLIAVAMIAAACGGSTDVLGGDDGVAAGDSADDSAGDGSSDDGSDDGSDDDGSSDDGGPTTVSGDFCSLAAEREAQETAFDNIDFTDPAAIEAALNENRDLLAEAIAAAPDEIRGDLEVVQEDFDRVYQVFADANFDALALADVDDSVFDDSPESDAAGERIDAYILDVCGIDPDANETDTSGPTGDNQALVADALMAFGFGAAESACLAEAVSLEEFQALSEGAVPDEILQRFIDCGVSLEELAEIGGGVAGEDSGAGDDGLSDGSSDDGTVTIPDGALGPVIAELVNQGFTQDEAECMAASLVAPETAGDIFAALESCGIPLERLQSLGG